jgi:hypothetical protein
VHLAVLQVSKVLLLDFAVLRLAILQYYKCYS